MSFTPLNVPTTNVAYKPPYLTPNPDGTNTAVPASWTFTLTFDVPLSNLSVPASTWTVSPSGS